MEGGPPMGGMGGGMPKFDLTIRWESADPVRAAAGTNSIAADPDSCIIAISDE